MVEALMGRRDHISKQEAKERIGFHNSSKVIPPIDLRIPPTGPHLLKVSQPTLGLWGPVIEDQAPNS
jgi:hypothetical protein